MLKLIERIVYCIRRGNLGTRIGISALVDGVLFGPSFHGLCGSLLKKKICYEEVNIRKKRKAKAVKGYYRRPGEVARTE